MNISVGKNSFAHAMVQQKTVKNSSYSYPTTNIGRNEQLPSNLRSYVSFKGNAPQITKASIVTSTSEDIRMEKTPNGGYIVEPQTQTELIYGNDAAKFLNKTDKFEYDTQITFPKKAEGKLLIDGKSIDIKENSTVLLNKGTDAHVVVSKGYPQILMTKQDYPWYSKHSNNNENPALKDKFKELVYRNSHTYNGEFKPNLFTKDENKNNEIVSKLINAKEVSEQRGGYIKFDRYPIWIFKKDALVQKGFTDEELKIIEPVYKNARQAKLDTKLALRAELNGLNEETVHKLEDCDVLFKNNKGTNLIYWKTNFESEEHLREALNKNEILGEEQESVVKVWNTDNKIGFDLTGLKFVNDNAAIYCLDDKLNNWSMEKSCWLTNSTELSSEKGTPSIGTSIVQANTSEPTPMSKLRNGEHLHTHPGLADKSQTELYIVTSGSAALTVVRDGVPKIKILKEGELAVIPPNTPHCVNSVMGEYEQVVSQIPSAFQYGLAFKQNMDMPFGYSEQQMEEQAREALLNNN